MAYVVIPTTADPHSSLTVTLENVAYVFELRWNTRALAWFLDVYDDSETLLAGSRKLVCDWPIIGYRDTSALLPQGKLWVYDTSGAQLDPTLDDLGTRVLLIYEESA